MSEYGSAAVVTPEAVQLDFPAAGVGSRMVAYLIDMMVVGTTFLMLAFGASLVTATEGLGMSDTFAVVVVLIVVFLLLFGYPVALETLWRGRTLGKAVLGLRVVTVEGAPIRFRHAAIRAALLLIDVTITSGAAGVISMLVTRRHQRLGDLVAGTMVLRQRVATSGLPSTRFQVPPGMAAYGLDPAALTPADYAMLRSFLLRAYELDPEARDELARRLADRFADKLGAPPPDVPIEQFLVTVAAAYQQRTAPRPGAPSPSPYPAPSSAPPESPSPPVLGDFVPPSG